MTMKITTSFKHRFNYKDIVYLKHDPEQYERMIIAIITYGTNQPIQYMLNCGDSQTIHFEEEINTDKNILFNLN